MPQLGRVFNEQQNIGRAKYVVNHHDGLKTHGDGSPFFDIAIFSNKRKKDEFVRGLRRQGYVCTALFHKSRGGEWDKVLASEGPRLDVGDNRWLGTAITRVAKQFYCQ